MTTKQADDNCPRCGERCSRDEVHNGLMILYGPWGCACGWSEDERYDQSVVKQPKEGYVDQCALLNGNWRERTGLSFVRNSFRNCGRFDRLFHADGGD